MTRHIAICDDSPIALRQLAAYLERLQAETDLLLVPAYFSSGEEVLAHMDPDTDLLLLDISMGGMNGMDCARALRDRGWDRPIVFITSMTEYALEGYSVHAFHFLAKPVTFAEFASVVRDALAKGLAEKPRPLLVPVQDGLQPLDPEALLYAEVYQHETSFVLLDRKVKSPIQLSAVEEELRGRGFFRVHKSFLVSLKQVRLISKDSLTLSNGEKIPMSKHRRKEFLDAYGSFMGAKLQ